MRRRRCGSCSPNSSNPTPDAVLLDIAMPGWDGVDLARVVSGVAAIRRPSRSCPRTTTAPSRRTRSVPWTTFSSRSGPPGWPRRSPGSALPGTRGADRDHAGGSRWPRDARPTPAEPEPPGPADAGRRRVPGDPRRTVDDRRRPGRQHPVRAAGVGVLGRGAGRLRPAAHRGRRQPPDPHPAGRAAGGVGGRPASSGCTAATWSRCTGSSSCDRSTAATGSGSAGSPSIADLPVSRRHLRVLKQRLLAGRRPGR